jgi:hypothetical protein
MSLISYLEWGITYHLGSDTEKSPTRAIAADFFERLRSHHE